jgi:hypothetical protein
MATRSKAEGNALEAVVEVFIGKAQDDASKNEKKRDDIIGERLAELRQSSGGFDFATVIFAYVKAWDAGDDTLKAAAIRWLRGEYTTKSEAKAALGVREIVNDANVYDYWKLLAQFVRCAGYNGLLIVLDELVNIYKLQNSKARENNYEQLLRMLNDVLQGQTLPLGFLMGGTPEFLRDPRRGVFSYSALQSRLADNAFAKGPLVDVSGPVIQLQNLRREELFVLLENIRHVFASGDDKKHLVPDEALKAFMERCETRLGNSYFRTPRTTVKQFVNFLSVLEQNRFTNWKTVLGDIEPETDEAPVLTDIIDQDDSDLTTIKLR